MTDEKTRTYEIVTSTGKQRITVPDSYKVTFGAIVPGAKATGYSGGGWGLRIWESANQQRAVFSDVISFRDLSLSIMVAAVRKFGDDEWTIDDGSYTGKKAETVEKQWRPVEEVRDVPTTGVATIESDDNDYPMTSPIRSKRF